MASSSIISSSSSARRFASSHQGHSQQALDRDRCMIYLECECSHTVARRRRRGRRLDIGRELVLNNPPASGSSTPPFFFFFLHSRAIANGSSSFALPRLPAAGCFSPVTRVCVESPSGVGLRLTAVRFGYYAVFDRDQAGRGGGGECVPVHYETEEGEEFSPR